MTVHVRGWFAGTRLAARLALLGLLLGSASGPGLAASFTARLDRTSVPVGESVTLSLTFEGAAPPGSPGLPEFPGFNIVPGISQRTEMTLNGGQQSLRRIFEYTLIPTRAGDLAIPALQVRVGNENLASAPLSLKVVPASAASPGTAPNQWAFLRVYVGKTNAYVGEPVPVEIQFYCRDCGNSAPPQLKAESFSFGNSAPAEQTGTRVGGVPYRLLTYRSSVTAAKPGLLTLGPAELRTVVVYQRNFFGDPARGEQVTLRSESFPMRVQPLPVTNVPPLFAGALGSYTLQVEASPTSVAVGDPITVRIQISGQGPIEMLSLPPQPEWTNNFSTYPPTATAQLRDALGLSGTKIFTNVLVPLNADIRVLPPFQFSFFDPQAQTYRTLSGPAIPLTVRPSATASTVLPPPTNAAAGRDAPPPEDILHIRARLDDLAPPRAPLARQAWFLTLQGVPLVAWVSLLVRRRRAESLANNPRLRRQRQAAQRVREGMQTLRAMAAANRSDEFFAALFRVLQEKLGERLDVPASAITEAVIDERLRPHGVPEATLSALHDLFQTCNLARYAPLKSSQELSALIPRVESVLRQLEEQLKP